jgi:3-deoxy-manno-octulosonate cytidylyltransferase (CMP-KDO synthetase)
MPLSTIAVIPARYASTRFPGKPLALLGGKPMIQHVYERVSRTRGLHRTLVATDDQRIASAVRCFGGEVTMTGECRSGTDRVCEAVRDLPAGVILNVQGDEPLIEPACLESLLAAFQDPSVQMATLKRPLDPSEIQNPNVVKVACDLSGDALYFSRSPIPFVRAEAVRAFAHVGVYAYRKPFLAKVAGLASTPLERAESLEQLRVLEHGYRIRVIESSYRSIGVDTPEDLERAEKVIGRGAEALTVNDVAFPKESLQRITRRAPAESGERGTARCRRAFCR